MVKYIKLFLTVHEEKVLPVNVPELAALSLLATLQWDYNILEVFPVVSA